MKRSILLLLILPLIGQLKAQQIDYSPGFLPEKKYTLNISQKQEYIIEFNAPKKKLKEMEKKGVKNPSKTINESQSEMVMICQKTDKDGKFPVTLEIVSMQRNQKDLGIPPGTIIYGSGYVDKIPYFDSVHAEGMPEKFKSSFLSAFQNILTQFSYPSKIMSVGDSLEVEKPVTLPVGFINLEMMVKSTYILTKVDGNRANFDLKQEFTFLNTNTEEITINGSGIGSGIMEYDSENRYVTFSNVDTDLQMEADIPKEELKVKLTGKGNHVQKNVISPY